MAVTNQEQIDRLKTQAEQYGWVDSQAFKDKVNTQYWAWSYDKLVKNVATWIQSGAVQGNMENANKVVSQTPVTPTTPVTPVTTEPVGTKIEPTTPKLPEATPIPTQPVEKVEIKTTETSTQPITPKPTNLWVIQGKNVTSEAPQFKWADWQTYKTVRFDDGSLWTVRVWEGWVNELVWNTYKDEQRADMKQIVEQGLNNAENVYRQIATGGVIPDAVKKSSVYSSAKKRFDDFSMYSTMTDNQLSSAIWNGNILPGTTLYEDLMKDPAQKARIEKIQKYNLIVWKTPKTEEVFTNKSNEIAGNTKVEIGWQTMTLKQALEDGFIDQNEMNAMTNNSEVITKAKEVETLKNEYDEKLRQYKNLEKTIKDELKGTWATTTDLAIAVANAQEKLLPWLQELESRTNNAIGTLTQMKSDSAQLFATNLSLYWQQQARQFQLEDRAYAEQQATKQLEQQYAYQFGDLNSDNPTLQNIAIERAVQSMYENYPIPGMESQSVKVQKVKNLMAQGMSGTQAIAQVESEIRNSQRYKDYLASERAKMMPQADNDFWFMSVWDWVIAVTNKSTGKIEFRNANWEPTSGWTTWDYYSQFRVTQDVWAKSPNSKDTWWNGGTPWLDLAMPVWTDVISTIWWRVISAQSNKDYWTQVIVEDSQGNKHMFSHLSDIWVRPWDVINPWDVIAKSWNTWFSTWPHLDYRVKDATGKWVDPKNFIGWNSSDLQWLWQFLKDNQNRGAWYSEDDVKAFNESIDRFIKEWDAKWMALKFRKNLLEDKDFKQEIDNVKKFQTWLTQVEKLISDYEKAGKSTNALKAMAEKVARATWLTTDEALAQMQTQMWFVMADYIKSISGTAASDAEVQRLMGNMANLWNVSGLNKTIISQVKWNSQAWLESMIDTRMYGLPEDFKYQVFEDIYWKTPTQTWNTTENAYNWWRWQQSQNSSQWG